MSFAESLPFIRKETRAMNYHDKFVPQPPVVFRDPPDVALCKRKIKALEQENAELKERLALQLDGLPAVLKEIG
jgi:hypothetical protein